MSSRDLFKMVFQNLLRLKFRVILTTLGVVIGTAAIITMVSLGVGLQRSATSSLEKEFGEATQLRVMPLGGEEMIPGPPPLPTRKKNQRRKSSWMKKRSLPLRLFPGLKQ